MKNHHGREYPSVFSDWLTYRVSVGSNLSASRRSGGATAYDQDRVRDFARSYTDAWCTHDPTSVAGHYRPGGTIAINGGEPAEMIDVARGFISAFPDIEVFMDDLVFKDETVEYHWTFTGTNTGPGGTGKSVRISGFEEWTLGDDGLVAGATGNYDQAEYDRQLHQGAPQL